MFPEYYTNNNEDIYPDKKVTIKDGYYKRRRKPKKENE